MSWNEQVKLIAATLNTIGIAIFAGGVVKPLVETGTYDLSTIFGYGYFALIIHLGALYILRFIQ